MSSAGYLKDANYQFLLEYYPGNTIFRAFNRLRSDVVNVIKGRGLEHNVIIDDESLENAILDFFTDMARLKDFHNITHEKHQKVYAYELYWFIRRHPVQITTPSINDFDINEKVAIGVFFPKILEYAGINYRKDVPKMRDRTPLFDFVNLLFYNLKYRSFNQQSLELMIEAFVSGNNGKLT
jgi:hypothetical protein